MNKFIPISKSRECGECTKCCEGWVIGTVYNYTLSPGQPCQFLGKNCTIYENRPADPCKNFTCQWIKDEEFPAWLKPSLSNVIILTRIDTYGNLFYVFKEAGSPMRVEILNWIILWAANNNKNIVYNVNGGSFSFGSREFNAYFTSLRNS